jgi:hypothetical protein
MLQWSVIGKVLLQLLGVGAYFALVVILYWRGLTVATGSGNGRLSVRRVGVTPLTRRCRANSRTCERPGQTKNSRGDYPRVAVSL